MNISKWPTSWNKIGWSAEIQLSAIRWQNLCSQSRYFYKNAFSESPCGPLKLIPGFGFTVTGDTSSRSLSVFVCKCLPWTIWAYFLGWITVSSVRRCRCECVGKGRRGQVALVAWWCWCVVARLAPPLGLACNYNWRGEVTSARRDDDVEWVVKNSKIELVRSLLVLFVIANGCSTVHVSILHSLWSVTMCY